VYLFHTPGHTKDSISVLDEQDGVLIAGDNIGDSDDDLLPSLACDTAVFKNTIQRYQAMAFSTCVSGHNRPQGKDVLDKILALLR
jgi:glyoxylase-like metal-dependent hydrolase (beta-lactamase superfamily II)